MIIISLLQKAILGHRK